MTFLVADISNNQADVNMAALKRDGVVAIIAKSSEGTSFRDSTYDTRRLQAKALGLHWGSYHFAHTGINGPAAEAAYYLSCARPAVGDLLPVLDAEYGTGRGAWVAEFLTAVRAGMVARKLGPDPVTKLSTLLYSGHWWLDERVDGREFPGTGSWVAAYQPTEPARLPGTVLRVGWQYTDGGGVQDLSRFELLPRIGLVKSSVPKKVAAAGSAAAVAAGGAGGGAAAHKTTPKPRPVAASPAAHPTASPSARPTVTPSPKPSPTSTTLGGPHPDQASYTASITLRHAQNILGVPVTGHETTAGDQAFGKLIRAHHTHPVGVEIDKLRKLYGLKLTGHGGTDLHRAWTHDNYLAGKAPR